jgi:hypothetical protein
VVRPFTKPVIRFGAIGLACIAIAFGAFYFFGRSDGEHPAATAAAKPARQARTTAAPAEEPAIPSDTARDQTWGRAPDG